MFSRKLKRNRLIIDGPVQWTMVGRIFVHWCAFAAMSFTVGWVAAAARTYWSGGPIDSDKLFSQQAPLLAVSFLMLPVFLLDTITLTHRFVGPMCRFRQAVSALIAGEEDTRLSFRPGDYWHDIARDFNSIAEQIRGQGTTSETVTVAAEKLTTSELTDNQCKPSATQGRLQKRTRNYVDRDVQGGMLRRVLGHWCAYIMICAVFGSAMLWMLDPLAGFAELIDRVVVAHGLSLLTAIVFVPIFAIDTIRMTHRIAGPMYRVRRELHQLVIAGRASRVTFRPTDMWQDVAPEFNAFCDYVEPKLAAASSSLPSDTHPVAVPC